MVRQNTLLTVIGTSIHASYLPVIATMTVQPYADEYFHPIDVRMGSAQVGEAATSNLRYCLVCFPVLETKCKLSPLATLHVHII